MKNTQKGMSFFGLVFTLAFIAFLALLVLKLVPVYIDYFTVKKAVATVAKSGGDPVSIRAAFERAAVIDRIDVITGRDLQIAGSGPGTTVSFAYDKTVPLFANISLYIEFKGSSSAGDRSF